MTTQVTAPSSAGAGAEAGAWGTPRPPAIRIAWQSWNARRGEPGPIHVRVDRPNGGKAVRWRTAAGLAGIGDHHLEDLVYLAQPLAFVGPGEVLVVGEGEKVADAIAAAGHWAVGTVCGASSSPSPAVVALLAPHRIVLAPDNDFVGGQHMGRLGIALETAGVPAISIVRNPVGSPVGWDLADASPELIRELVSDAIARPIGPVYR